MDYRYFKSRSLNTREKKRLHLSDEIDSRLRLLLQNEADLSSFQNTGLVDSANRLIQEIVSYLSLSSPNISNPAIDWMLSYASPETLQWLTQILSGNHPAPDKLKFFSLAAPSQILTKEQIMPDYQWCQINPDPRSALVCFTGNSQRLNMPLQLFHGLLGRKFDIVIYLRDDKRQRFVHGVPGMGSNLWELGKAIADVIPTGCHTAVLSTSSGGVAAFRIAEVLDADRVALFSPEFSHKDELAVGDPGRIGAKKALLYFSALHPFDNRLANQWSATHLGPSIRYIECKTHGTLANLVYSLSFQPLIDWLAGRRDTSDW